MNVLGGLRALPLRSKLGLTFVTAGLAVLAAAAFFSFRYWHEEMFETAREQATVAAASVQASVESVLLQGRVEAARRSLSRLQDTEPVDAVRVYDGDGRIFLSADPAEEGRRAGEAWIPDARELPPRGLARTSPTGDAVHLYLPLRAPEPAVLEMRYSVLPLQAAVRRGMAMGIGLVVLAVLALALVVGTMLEREVMGPLQRMEGLLAENGQGGPRRRRDEIRSIESSMAHLIRSRREEEARAAERDQELARREGFAQVGELAAEMAHEFKRPLASIRSAMDLLDQEYELDDGSQRVLSGMNQQLERLSETMQDLFSLAKPVAVERTAVHLPDVLDEALVELAGHPAMEKVTVSRRYADDVPAVAADGRRLEQAFLNVILNAAEAMPDGGEIVVVVQVGEGDTVEVRVRDTGVGMPPETVREALHPFYSTKPRGTGLGLPLVARVVAAHGGDLGIESARGRGTTVWIALPVHVRGGAPKESEWATSGS